MDLSMIGLSVYFWQSKYSILIETIVHISTTIPVYITDPSRFDYIIICASFESFVPSFVARPLARHTHRPCSHLLESFE